MFKSNDKDTRRRNLREGLPAYAYSRGVELHSNRNPSFCKQPEKYDPRRNVLNISYPIDVPEFGLPNEEQILYYEQLMKMSNETIVLSNFLENKQTQITAIQQKPESIQGQTLKNVSLKKSPEILPFYKTCFKTIKIDTKWNLCLINEHSCELRFEIKQIYLHMWLYYENYMEKVDLGVLDTCNRMMGFGQTITETERFYLIIRDDYLMASQTMVLLKHVLSNRHASIFEMFMETLESWKNLLQKMSTNPKLYDLSPTNTLVEMTELLKRLVVSYVKTRHFLEFCFVSMMKMENTIEEEQLKDDILCKYWYLMVDPRKDSS
ncbi:Hypothetical protein CINCED_3A000102 [Cinara cedri]|uniref:Uncharacterized protein n=1 Tax=Cinara cedri TaxID=506608 RepID=A0A5E4M6Z0_9HEMI|nr:Hypothetical protein CINCED_3A000102 [Cinara cedri]